MEKRMILILGRPGVGKTRLAGTFPQPYFLDLENGAATAHPGIVLRKQVKPDAQVLSTVRGIIDNLNKMKVEEDAIWIDRDGVDHAVRTVVVDSVDAIQQAAMDFNILRPGRYKMERQDWGTLLNMMRPINMMLASLPVNVVVTAHTKTREGEQNRPGVMDLAVQGALKDQMPRWYDAILHIVELENSRRVVVSQPTIYKNSRWLAKDRHNLLKDTYTQKGKSVDCGVTDLPADEAGYPSSQIAKAFCGEEYYE